MEKLIIEPKSVAELESLINYLKENGIGFITEEEQEQLKRRESRKNFIETLNAIPKSDISFNEITEIVEQVRSERYAQEDKNHL